MGEWAKVGPSPVPQVCPAPEQARAGPEHDFTTTKRERNGVKIGIHYQCR
jgi:hypothetical protein